MRPPALRWLMVLGFALWPVMAQAQIAYPVRRLPPPSDQNTRAVVRMTPDFRRSDVMALRDDQVIETQSGRHVSAARLKLILSTIEHARTRPARPARFAILPRAVGPCTPPAPGETQAQLLARPANSNVCTPSGHPVSVAQLRAMAPFANAHPQAELRRQQRSGSAPERTIQIASFDDLHQKARSSLRQAPDSTVLVSPKGTRITLGALRQFLLGKRPPGVLPARDQQR